MGISSRIRRSARLHRALTPKGATVLLVAGALLAAALGWLWQDVALTQQRQAFDIVANNIGARVAASMRQNMDLVTTARAIVETNPAATNDQFVQFMTALDAPTRYKDAIVVVYMEDVAQDHLGAFWASIGKPVQGTVGSNQVIPPGPRPQYCLLRAGALQILGLGIFSTGAAIPAGTDYCATPGALQLLTSSADTGKFAVASIQQGLSLTRASLQIGDFNSLPPPAQKAITTLFSSSVVVAPIYTLGSPLTTVAERRAALLGWAVEVVDVQDIVASAIGTSALSATVSYRNPSGVLSTVVRISPPHATRAFSSTIHSDINGSWTISLAGSSPVGGLSPFGQGALAGVGVFLINGLLILLVVVLARSRANALDLVDRRTSQLAHQALHDALTGLPNRSLVLDRATQMLARARREHRHIGALFLDLDNFKTINDSLGHAAGDQLLQALSARLANVLRASDTVGRMGGDEFVILVEDDQDDIGLEVLAERLLAQLRRPYVLEGVSNVPFTVTASIGIARGMRDSAEDLLRDADIALYAAKAAGKNCCRVFRSEMQYAVADRLELEMDLWTALERGQLFVLYQPIVELGTEALCGVEALLRWHHPTRGLMSPETFIPIAEDTGLILPIGRWVLVEACRRGAEWNRTHPGLAVSVNLSARQLESDELLDEVRMALDASGLEPSLLTLEITESALMRDGPAARDRLRDLKALGVRVAVDDFGTGYSSFAYLQQFPVDALKIDQSFIKDVATRGDATALVRTLIQLGKGLNLETLAEGIETRAQLSTLQLEQCDKGQGFLFSRPVDAMAIDQYIGAVQP